MRLSEHAKQRWDERCSDLNLEDELVTLRPAGRPLLRKLRWLWENMHGAASTSNWFASDKGSPGRDPDLGRAERGTQVVGRATQ